MAKIDVDPDVLTHEGNGLTGLAQNFPTSLDSTAGDTGSPDVNNAVGDMTVWVQASWQALTSNVEGLASSARKAAEQYRTADKKAADDAHRGKKK